ncbi:MAG: N-acetylglucosamine-6-phosphate deacetylase [Gammaproteobacteria bacterium]|nr:N-acetylglucosamine-6-phosphate deacetylase [Gammaproteobacteria bacterium]
MKTISLNHARVFDGETFLDDCDVVIEEGRISAVGRRQSAGGSAQAQDLEGRLLVPGLVDLQVNGGGGMLFNDAPSVETIRNIGAAHRRFGTTGFLPTLISDTPEKTRQAVDAVRQAIEQGVPGVLGIHLEGPFLAGERRGIHDESHFRALDDSDLELLASLDNGVVLLTVAPEKIGPQAIERLVRAGVVVFGGHSAASYDEARTAFEAGMSGVTHLFNAMSPFAHREPGLAGAALEDRYSYAGIIADGHHVHPAALAIAASAKTTDRLCLVTDAMATVGSLRPTFDWYGHEVTAVDGCCRLPDGALAGSDLDMLSAVRNAMRFMRADLGEALRMASTNPARALGLGQELGRIRRGYRACLLELDEGLELRRSWCDGEAMEIAENAD